MGPLLALEWATIGFGAAGGLRLALKPPFRRDLAALPALGVALALAGLVVGALAVTVFVWQPWTLHVAAALVILAGAFLWWRGRPSYGRVWGWPPGSLGIGASLDAIDDKWFYRDQAAQFGPVFKMSQFGRPVLCVVGLARGRALLQEHRDALEGAALPYNRFASKGLLRYMPSADHQAEAPLFRRAFSETALAEREPALRAACRAGLDGLAQRSATHRDGIDIRPFLSQWAVEGLTGMFLGIDADDERSRRMGQLVQQLEVDRSGGLGWSARMERSLSAATQLLRDLAARESSQEPAHLLGALVRAAPETLQDEGRLRNLVLFLRLGSGDLAGTLTWLAYQLSANAPWQDAVQRAGRTAGAPQGVQPSDLGTRVVLETLRLEQSEYLYRRVVKPFTYEGFHVPAGWILRICVQESHRDPGIFPDPSTFNPDRFLGRTLSKSEYATFGLDGHGCMGASMVHFFGRIFVEELCHAYTIRTVRDAPPEHGTRHRHHWRPGRRWTVALDRRPT
ncbi:MAG: cytochrome P450 [Gemmatimonadetes bacterium]|nr:cytochrome P450 [Gemmatimonadota bacterium]